MNPYKQVEHTFAGLLSPKPEFGLSTLGLACNISKENQEFLLWENIPDVDISTNKDALSIHCSFYHWFQLVLIFFLIFVNRVLNEWLQAFPLPVMVAHCDLNQHYSPTTTYKTEI